MRGDKEVLPLSAVTVLADQSSALVPGQGAPPILIVMVIAWHLAVLKALLVGLLAILIEMPLLAAPLA